MTDTNTGADLSATEDLDAFEASFFGGDDGAEQSQPQAAKPDEGDAGEGEQGGEGEGPAKEHKPKKTAQQRIDELTWRANEAERREQAALERERAALAGKQPAAEQQQPAADTAPDPNDYEFGEEDAAFIRDHAKFEARQEFQAERQREEAERSQTAAREAFDKRTAEAFPDGETEGFKAFCAIERVPRVLNDVIMISEVGPQLAAHYGDSPDALKRLSAMPLHLQAYEVAKVEARLTGSTAPAPAETKPKPKIATDAPNPAPQVRGSGGQFTVPDDTDDLAAFEKRFYARR